MPTSILIVNKKNLKHSKLECFRLASLAEVYVIGIVLNGDVTPNKEAVAQGTHKE